MASLLRMKAKQEGVDVAVDHSGIERQCEHEFFNSANGNVEWADAVLSLACGAGVQFTSEKWPHKVILPGLNTAFVGVVEAAGEFTERCLMCGDCILHFTGGVCPITRCSKSLLNGPCGGSENGVCEIDSEVSCGWQLIYDRLRTQGRLESLVNIIPAKNWISSRHGGPRKLFEEHLRMPREDATDGN